MTREAGADGRGQVERDAALIAAAGRGDIDEVRRLLRQGASVAATDGQGRTALIAAAYGDHLEVGKLLIEAGADVNVQDNTKQSAYLIPTADGSLDFLRLTLQAGARCPQPRQLQWHWADPRRRSRPRRDHPRVADDRDQRSITSIASGGRRCWRRSSWGMAVRATPRSCACWWRRARTSIWPIAAGSRRWRTRSGAGSARSWGFCRGRGRGRGWPSPPPLRRRPLS